MHLMIADFNMTLAVTRMRFTECRLV